MRHLFIINPAAGSHNQTESYRKKIAEVCEKRGLDYSIRVSGAPGRCRKIAREAAESGKEYKLYAAMGRHWKFANDWKKYIITSEPEFEHYFGQRATKKRKLYNGMIKCDYYMYTENRRKK